MPVGDTVGAAAISGARPVLSLVGIVLGICARLRRSLESTAADYCRLAFYAQVRWRALAGFLVLLPGHDGSNRWNGFRNLLPCASR